MPSSMPPSQTPEPGTDRVCSLNISSILAGTSADGLFVSLGKFGYFHRFHHGWSNIEEPANKNDGSIFKLPMLSMAALTVCP